MPHNWMDWLVLVQTALNLPVALVSLRDIIGSVKKHLPQQERE